MSDDINEIHFLCDFVSLFLFCLHQKKKKKYQISLMIPLNILRNYRKKLEGIYHLVLC